MNIESVPVTVKILEKEYRIACPKNEKEELLASVEYLKQRMSEIRNSGKVVGAERVAVLAALNIAHELLRIQYKSDGLRGRMRGLNERVASVIDEDQVLPAS
jgi:cell division protein ZapA